MPLAAIIPAIAAAYGAISGHSQQEKANKLQQQALDQAQQQYDARAPFRNLGLQQLGHAEQPYHMGALGLNTSNPFARTNQPSNADITGTGGNTFTAPTEVSTTDQNAATNDAVRKIIQGGGGIGQMMRGLQALPGPNKPAPASYGWTPPAVPMAAGPPSPVSGAAVPNAPPTLQQLMQKKAGMGMGGLGVLRMGGR